MYSTLIKAFSESKSIFRFTQKYGASGLILFKKHQANVLWLDDQLIEELALESSDENQFHSDKIVDPAYHQVIQDNISPLDQAAPFMVALSKRDNSLKTFDAHATSFQVENETYILVSLKKSDVKEPSSLFYKQGANEHEFLELLHPHAFYLIKTDLEGNYTFINDYFCKRLHIDREEAMGKSSFMHILPEDHGKCIEVVERCFAQPGTSQQVILRKPSPGGGTFTNEWFFSLRMDDNGNPLEFICTGFDVSIHNFQLLYEKAPTMLHSIDQEGKLINVSDYWLSKLGYSRGEVIGKKSSDFLTPESREYAINEVLPQFFKDHYCHDIYYQMVRKDGSIIHVLLSAVFLGDSMTETPVSIAYLRDITQEVKSKAKNKQLSDLIDSILNNTKIQMWAFDGEKYSYMNQEWFNYTGQDSNSPLTVERWTEKVHPDDLDASTATWLKHWETKTPHENYFRLKRYDGQYRSFHCYTTPIFDDKGAFLHFQGYNIDITDQLKAEQALKEREEKYRLITEQSSELICMHQPDGVYTYVSPSAFQLTGYTPEELIGKNGYELIHPEDIPKVQEESHRVALAGSDVINVEFRHKRKNGEYFWASTFTNVVKDGNGTVSALITRTRDISEKVKYIQEIEQKEESLTIATEGANVGLWDWDTEKDIITMNEQWASIIGYELSDFPEKNYQLFASLCHPEDLPKIEKEINRWFSGENQEYKLDFRMRHKNGYYVWVRTIGKVIQRDIESKPTRIAGCHLDITEQIIAQTQAKYREEKLQNLTANVPGLIYEYNLDPDGKTYFSFVSKGLEIINPKLEANQLLKNAMLATDYIIPEDKEKFFTAIQESGEKLSKFDVQFRVERNNAIYWNHAISMPYKKADGTITWSGVVLDITDKKNAIAQYNRLAHVAESTGDLILICDKNGRATWVNKEHEKVLGSDYQKEKVLGTLPSERIKTNERGRVTVLALEAALIKQQEYRVTVPIYNSFGKLLWFSIKVQPIFNDRGEFLYSIISKREVSDLIERQEQLKKLLDTSSEQNSRLKEYAYITSHNIRSSVARLSGLIRLIRQFPEDTNFLNKLDSAVVNLDNTIHNINELLHLENDFSTDDRENVSIIEVVNRVIELNSTGIEKKEAEISFETTPDNPFIKTVPAYFESILQNLLTNALKYGVTYNQKNISILISQDADQTLVKVKDNGMGIDLKNQGHRLFKLGARLHEVSKGQGIGLFMTKRQVEALGGTIEVESEPYKGTTFSISLPKDR